MAKRMASRPKMSVKKPSLDSVRPADIDDLLGGDSSKSSSSKNRKKKKESKRSGGRLKKKTSKRPNGIQDGKAPKRSGSATKKKTSKRSGVAQREKASKRLNGTVSNLDFTPIGHVERVGEARRRRTLYLHPDLDRRIAAAAVEQGTRVSDLIAAAIERYLTSSPA